MQHIGCHGDPGKGPRPKVVSDHRNPHQGTMQDWQGCRSPSLARHEYCSDQVDRSATAVGRRFGLSLPPSLLGGGSGDRVIDTVNSGIERRSRL